MNNRELCHQWIYDTKGKGRGSNLRYQSGVLYSYHTEIGKLLKDQVVWIWSRSYSVATGKHLANAISAIPANYHILQTPAYPCNDGQTLSKSYRQDPHLVNIEWYINAIDKYLAKIYKARTRARTYAVICEKLSRDIKIYLHIFRCKSKLPYRIRKLLPTYIDHENIISQEVEQLIEDKEIKAAAYNKKQEERRQIKLKKDIDEAIQEIELWKTSNIDYTPIFSKIRYRGGELSAMGEDEIRLFSDHIRIKDGRIETTRGAEVSLKEARVLYKKMNKNPSSIIGSKFSNGYSIDNIKDDFVKIGCHTISIREIHEIMEMQ